MFPSGLAILSPPHDSLARKKTAMQSGKCPLVCAALQRSGIEGGLSRCDLWGQFDVCLVGVWVAKVAIQGVDEV